MITKIKIYNRFYMDLVVNNFASIPYKDWALISIHSDGEAPLFLDPEYALFQNLPIDAHLRNIQERGCAYAMSIKFDDVLPTTVDKKGKGYLVFDERHAKRIIDFLDKLHEDKEEFVLVIHCHAGISRSGAVAYYASQKYGIEFHDPNIFPNKWMVELLCRESKLKIRPFDYDSANVII